MTIQNIRDGLYATLTACGPYAATQISTCDFGVLEGAASCAIVFLPDTGTISQPLSMGNPRAYQRIWSISGAVYIKDTGDPRSLLSLVWQAHDDLCDTLRKDDTLNGTAEAARLTRLSFNKDVFIQAGGAIWAEVKWNVLAEEF